MSFQSQKSDDEIKEIVKDSYSQLASKYLDEDEIIHTPDHAECCSTDDDCCKPTNVQLNILTNDSFIPSFGCDTELLSIANPKVGETIVDLGSGPGKDALAAAQSVGETGFVYGIDMTDEMLRLATKNADQLKLQNIRFLKGDISNLPLESEVADLVISNCVVNLVPDKQSVFEDSFRILKPGGRFVIADMITLTDLTSNELTDDLFCACIGGATSEKEYTDQMKAVGFRDVSFIRRNINSTKSGNQEISYASSIFIGYK